MLEALQSSAAATAIGQSQAWLASLSALHLVGFTLVLGSGLVANLALIGAVFGDRAPLDVLRPSARLLAAGLVISAGTGALQFLPRAEGTAVNGTFQLKLLLVALAALVQMFAAPRVASAGRTAAARLCGAAGLALWLGAAVTACVFILLE